MQELLIDNERILIVAPHPDDESIGCGGVLASCGQQCDVLLLTNGNKGHRDEMSDDECAAIRHEEFVSVMKISGATILGEWRLPDGKLKENLNDNMKIDLTRYDFIFIPHADERHRDHCAASVFFRRIYKAQKCKAKLFGYEISRPLYQPTHYFVLNDIIEEKEKLINQYTSQLKIEDYVSLSRGLSMYRGAACKVGLVEAYESIDEKDKRTNGNEKRFREKLKHIRKRIIKALRKCYHKVFRLA